MSQAPLPPARGRGVSGEQVDGGPPTPADLDRRRRTLVHLLDVLGIDLQAAPQAQQAPLEHYIELLLEIRRKLREIKQWALADEVRDRRGALGGTGEDEGGEATARVEH